MEYMKQALLVSMGLLLAALLCKPGDTYRHEGITVVQKKVPLDSASIAGDWWLVPVLASDTAAGKLPQLRFELSGNKFSGFTGCNQMNGTFRVVSDQLQFDKDIRLTKIACEGYNEKEFLLNLLRVDHYRIKDGELWLMIDQTPVSKWMRKPDSKKTV